MGSKAETSTYCRSCLYDLRGIGEASRCPECGRAFDLADPKSFTTHPRRKLWWRRLRWVVYPLLLLALAAGCGVGWLWWGWHREQAAIAWVDQHHGTVQTKSAGPFWLQNALGRWAYLLERGDVVGALIAADDKAAESPLWRLDRLTFIRLQGPGVTDEWVALLCQRLRPAGVHLSQTSLTDGGLVPLRRLRSLRELSLGGSPISDDGLVHLKDLTELTWLDLDGTRVRGPGFAHLAGLQKLELLLFRGTPVDSRALEHLAKLTKLKELNASGTDLEDSIIPHLTKLTSLRELNLRMTRITPDGIARLRAALPNCQITGP